MEQLFPLMQPILTKQPPVSSDWIHQTKYDGIRLLCKVQQSTIQLLTRNQKERNRQYPEIIQMAGDVNATSFILDGEVIVRSKTGKPDFSLVVRRDRSTQKERIAQLMAAYPLEYQVFDLLMKDGEDLRSDPLHQRLSILQEIIQPNDSLLLVETHQDGQQLYRQMESKGWEGVVSKRFDSPYTGGKNHQDWVKTKVKKQLVCVACGVQYKEGFPNSLLLGVYQEEDLHFVGKVSSGLANKDVQLLHHFISQIEQSHSPLINPPHLSLPVKWIDPQLTLLVQYSELTAEGFLRHPKILGFTKQNPKQARWPS